MTSEFHQKVKQVFFEALAIEANNRDAWLDEKCGGDHVLRQEIASLLENHADSPLLTVSQVPGLTDSSLSSSGRFQTPTFVVQRSLWERARHRGRQCVIVALIVSIWLVLASTQAWFGAGVSQSLRDIRGNELQSTLGTQTASVSEFLGFEIERHQACLRPRFLRATIENLLSDTTTELARNDIRVRNLMYFKNLLGNDVQFVLLTPSYEVAWDHTPNGNLATSIQQLLAQGKTEFSKHLAGVLHGKPYLKAPDSAYIEIDPNAATTLTLFLPLYGTDDNDSVTAVVAFRSTQIAERLAAVIAHGRMQNSLETYAVNSEGWLLSDSRFLDQLTLIGRIPHRARNTTIMQLACKDPGVDMTAGEQPTMSEDQWPLTLSVHSLTRRKSGINLDGYRDYRGRKVIGAWSWIDEYNLGLVTEMDHKEAYASLDKYNRYYTFRLIFSTVALSILMLMLLNLNGHWSSSLQDATLAQPVGENQIGAYSILREIGAGGMGVVYLAQHSLLKRNTALKLLKPEQVNRRTRALFEREVQLISSLNHPNIVQVYDSGSTLSGLFYYAMEYVDGMTLDELVERSGVTSPARTVHIMKQVCGALQVAHSKSLIHRDIKPHNIMICHKEDGGDMVKLLDFGLVKQMNSENAQTLTGAWAGTPRYMAPERFHSPGAVDERTDIYSVGAVTYWLLVGQHPAVLNVSNSSSEIAHPSNATKQLIPTDLDQLVADCLSVIPELRPQSTAELLRRLGEIRLFDEWTVESAEQWWSTFQSATTDAQQVSQT